MRNRCARPAPAIVLGSRIRLVSVAKPKEPHFEAVRRLDACGPADEEQQGSAWPQRAADTLGEVRFPTDMAARLGDRPGVLITAIADFEHRAACARLAGEIDARDFGQREVRRRLTRRGEEQEQQCFDSSIHAARVRERG